jgi:type IV secretion system protein VirB10
VPEAVQGERHVSAVAGSGGFSKKQGVMLIGCAAGAALAFILLRPHAKPVDHDGNMDQALQVHQVTHYEPPPLPRATPATFAVPAPQVPAPPLPAQANTVPNFMQTPPDPMLKARHAPLFVYSASTGGSTGQQAQAGQEGGSGGPVMPGAMGPSELAAKLQATSISGVTANVLRHRPYLLTQGTVVPCVLQAAMDSTLPGFVTCVIPQDITGKTGITLLDRGTKVVGQFQGGIRQGQARLFVLWTRAETPTGVIINLDSPASDPLGRSGFGGEVDTHFWQRFGGALMLTFVDGAIQAGVSAASKSGSTYINTGNLSSATDQALQSSVNIQPTLQKNQGELVSIFVARDLDFSTVYKVGTAVAGQAGAP